MHHRMHLHALSGALPAAREVAKWLANIHKVAVDGAADGGACGHKDKTNKQTTEKNGNTILR
eukprot:780759-Pyramimonas_sp.AAC.1